MPLLTQRLARNVGLVMGGRAVGLAINAFTLLVIARLLGPERFGVYAVALVFVTLVSTAFDNGTNLAVARALARDPASGPTLLGNAIVMKAASGLLLTAAAILVAQAPVFPPQLARVLPFAAPLILVTALSVVNAFFQVQLRMGVVVAGDLVTRCTFIVLALVVLRLGGDVVALFVVQAIAAFAGLAVVLGRALAVVRPVFRMSAPTWRVMVAPTLSISAAFALGQIAARFDILALSAFSPARDVGLYSMAFRVIDVVLLLPAIVLQVVFPVFVDRSRLPGDQLGPRYRRVADLLAFTGLPPAILLSVFASDVLRLAGGAAYADGGPSLAILAWGMLAVYLSSGMYYLLMAAGHERAQLVWSAVGAVVAVVASLGLVPRLGPTGAALAACLAHGTMLAGGAIDIRRRLGVVPWPRALPELGLLLTALTLVCLSIRLAGGGVFLGVLATAVASGVVVAVSGRLRAEIGAVLRRPAPAPSG